METIRIQKAIDKARVSTPLIIAQANNKHRAMQEIREEKFQKEISRLKSLKLKASRETQYDKDLRIYVPRDRIVGCDGVVRTTRLRNEQPMSMPEESDYKKLFRAFSEMRRKGIDAKWNILASTYGAYYCEVVEDGTPRVTHYKPDGTLNSPLSRGLTWNREWDAVQDQIDIETWCGAKDEAVESLKKYGLRTEQNPHSNDENHLVILFRGEVKSNYSIWNWIDNCISDSPTDPPPIP
jgi:hypothetical protein